MKLLKGFEQKILSIKDVKTVKVFYRTAIVFFSVIFLACLVQVTKLKSEYNVKQFFPKSHILLSEEQQIKDQFKLQDKSALLLIISLKSGSTWLNKGSLVKLKKLTTNLKSLHGVEKIFSLDQLQGTYENKTKLFVGPLFEQVPPAEWKNLVTSQPFIRPFLLSNNQQETLVALELTENNVELIKRSKADINKLFKTKFQDLSVSIGGIPSLQSDVSILLNNELVRSVAIGLLVFAFILFLIFKGYAGFILTLINLLFVNVICLGVLSFFHVTFDVLLSTLPVLISLSVISMTVQILIRHAQRIQTDSVALNPVGNISEIYFTLKDLFLENVLVSLTTILGFMMLATSQIEIIKKYGFVVSLAICLSSLLTQVLIVPLVLIFPRIELRTWFLRKAYWSLIIFKFKKEILLISSCLLVISVFSFWNLNWSARLFNDLPKTNAARINTEHIDENFGGTLPLSVTIYGSVEMWKDPAWILRLNLLTEDFRKLASVGSALSMADLMKKTNSTGYRLPTSKQESAESLFLFSMAESDPTVSFLNQQSGATRIDLRLRDLNTQKIFADEKKISSLIKNYFPNVKFQITGMATSVHKMNTEMSKDLILGFWQSILIIAIFLIFVFRSYRWTIIACLPNLIPPLFLIFVLAAKQTAIKPSIAIIFSIAIGLAFTNTIYILIKLKKLTGLKTGYLPIKKTMLLEMTPCFLSTLLATSAFMVFLFSYFDMNKMFGAYMIVSLLSGAYADLIFLPALLSTFPKLLLSKNLPTKAFPVFLLAFFIHFSNSGYANPKLIVKKTVPAQTAAEIFNQSKKLVSSQDDSADVLMKIIESDGSVKERNLSILRKQTASVHSTLIRLHKPLDLKGTALLSQIENGSEQQWIYLPSTKQSRRVVGANKKGTVLGSELSPQDLDFTTLKSARSNLIKTLNYKGHKYALIEIKSGNNETSYSKAIILISLETHLPMRIDYQNAKNQTLKRVEFDQYQAFNGVQRAQSIKIKNLVNKRGTDLIFSNIKSNSGLSNDVFSQRALTKE